VRTVEDESVVDHQRHEPSFKGCADSAPVQSRSRARKIWTGAHPRFRTICRDQAAQEIGKVTDFLQQHVRQEVINGELGRIAWNLDPKWRPAATGIDCVPSSSDSKGFSAEIPRDRDHGRIGTGDLQVTQEYRSDQLIDEYPPMLRIIQRFDDVETPSSPRSGEIGRLRAFF